MIAIIRIQGAPKTSIEDVPLGQVQGTGGAGAFLGRGPAPRIDLSGSMAGQVLPSFSHLPQTSAILAPNSPKYLYHLPQSGGWGMAADSERRVLVKSRNTVFLDVIFCFSELLGYLCGEKRELTDEDCVTQEAEGVL